MSIKSKYIIKDWAGNTCFKGKTFPTFEDAWNHIRESLPDNISDKEYDETLGEYHAEILEREYSGVSAINRIYGGV